MCTLAPPPQISPYSQLLLSSEYICEGVKRLIGWKCAPYWSHWQCYLASLARWQLLYYSHTQAAALLLPGSGCGLWELPPSLLLTPPPTQSSALDRHEIAPLLRLLLSSWKQLSSYGQIRAEHASRCIWPTLYTNVFMCLFMHGCSGTFTQPHAYTDCFQKRLFKNDGCHFIIHLFFYGIS